MLERYRFWKINSALMQKGISIKDLCEEIDRFINSMNSVKFTNNFIDKLNRLEQSENSIRTILNMIFSRMNPELNEIIYEEDQRSGNYGHLILRIEKLTNSIGDSRQTLTRGLSNKVDLESNIIVNNQNIYSFTSHLSGILNNLIYSSILLAYQSLYEIELKAGILMDEVTLDGRKIKGIIIKTDPNKKLFNYLLYLYFLRTMQSTVPIFSNLKSRDFDLKIQPPEVSEFQKLYNRKLKPLENNVPDKKPEDNPNNENNEDNSNKEDLDDEEEMVKEVFENED